VDLGSGVRAVQEFYLRHAGVTRDGRFVIGVLRAPPVFFRAREVLRVLRAKLNTEVTELLVNLCVNL